MQDLTQYSDDELSLQVFNTEYFYIERHNPELLTALVRQDFLFTHAQLLVLLQDLADDAEEQT